MTTKKAYKFEPDYAIHPGEILGEILEARQISQVELASRCGLSEKHVSQIVNGKVFLGSSTALVLERALGVAASLWMSLESNYRLHMARQEEQDRLTSYYSWASRFPLHELVARGWLKEAKTKEGQVQSLLEFLGLASPEAWEKSFNRAVAAYRKSPAFKSSTEAVTAWLRIGEKQAEGVDAEPFDRALFVETLRAIRNLTCHVPQDFELEMKRLCRKAGVVLVFEPELPRSRLSGATMWVSPRKALIMQSLRHRTDGHFWFTFFHEAAHVLLHGKRSVFIDEPAMDPNEEEEQANDFAANFLIPEKRFSAFVKGGTTSRARVTAFAQSIGIAPGIVVGRLQHDGIIPHGWMKDLKRTFVFRSEA